MRQSWSVFPRRASTTITVSCVWENSITLTSSQNSTKKWECSAAMSRTTNLRKTISVDRTRSIQKIWELLSNFSLRLSNSLFPKLNRKIRRIWHGKKSFLGFWNGSWVFLSPRNSSLLRRCHMSKTRKVVKFFRNCSTCSTNSSRGFNWSWMIQLIHTWRSIVISVKNNLKRIQEANFYFLMHEVNKKINIDSLWVIS